MHYALTPRTFVFSHYFYTGVRIAIGVAGLTFAALALSDLPTALSVGIGALCTSLMDMPSPLRHKFNEMLSGVLLCTVVAFVASLSTPYHWLLIGVMVAVSFLASMMVVYGRKAMPLQFAAIFIMMLSTESAATPRQALLHGALFFAGGMAYLGYAMAVVWLIQKRLKQQVLAEALYELARYTRLKAACYEIANKLDEQLEKLVRQQVVLAEKQQAARELIMRGGHARGDATLVRVHYAMFDLYELVLSTHTDYALLRRHFAGTEVLPLLGQLVGKAALDIESVAYAMMRNRPSGSRIDYRAQIDAIESALRRTAPSAPGAAGDAAGGEARAVLRAACSKMREMAGLIARMHGATRPAPGAGEATPGADLAPFLSQQRYGFGLLVSNLRWSSPVFRFALRVALAVLTGLLVADLLPYSSHGYWTAITIAVILKPSFSLTRQRRADRVIGTVIGCLATALILKFVHSPVALLGFLFLATAAAPAFLHIKYRYTAVAASMQILLLIGLTDPNVTSAIGERLLDTLIGAVIATFFSYVLPNWEYQDLPRLVRDVLTANRQYVEASRDLLQGRVEDDFTYRVSRKRFMDSLASLSAALGRMLDEPAAKQRAAPELNRFTLQNYLLVSHFSAIRLLLQRYHEGLPREAVNALVGQLCRQVGDTLAQAQQALAAATPGPAAAGAAATAPAPVAAGPGGQGADWPGWAPLQRRARLLLNDANGIAAASGPIGPALGLPG